VSALKTLEGLVILVTGKCFGATNIPVLAIRAFVNKFNKGLVTQASGRQLEKTLSKQNIGNGGLDVSLEFFYRVQYFIVLDMAAYVALVFQKPDVS